MIGDLRDNINRSKMKADTKVLNQTKSGAIILEWSNNEGGIEIVQNKFKRIKAIITKMLLYYIIL